MSFDAIDRQFRHKPAPRLGCARCGSVNGVEMEDSRTQYDWEGEWDDPANPNRPVALCRSCAPEHHRYWDDMWAEYWSGRL